MNPRNFMLCIVLISMEVSALPVSVILSDDVWIENNTVTHSLNAFSNIQNVTVIDYFSDVDVRKIETKKEKFLEKEWNSIKIEIGGLQKGENKTISYKILRGNGTALLGADTYYLEGEKHQLAPSEMELNLKQQKDNLVWLYTLILFILLSTVYLLVRRG